MNYGTPKYDGSGRGIRSNFNRAGCCGSLMPDEVLPQGFHVTAGTQDNGFKLWHGIALAITAIGAIIFCKKV